MKKLNQKGFGVIEWLLLLIILIILALIGWWGSQQSKSNNSSSTPESSQQSKKTEPAKTEPKAVKYLEIKEFGIKMPLGDEITGAYYVIRAQTQGDPAEYADIFDAGFDGTANKNGVKCKDASFPLFVVGRVKQADLAQVGEQDKDSYKQLAVSNVYLFSGTEAHQANPVCSDLTPNGNYTADTAVMDTLTAKQKAITAAYSKVAKL